MKSMICLFASLALASAAILLEVDGQWHPKLDGSILGSGELKWGRMIAAPAIIGTNLIGHPIVHSLKKRAAAIIAAPLSGLVNPNALNLPLDEITVAAAKNAQLIQQATEGIRNILGGGIPLALPADTPEVAASKVVHALAMENQKLATRFLAGHSLIVPGIIPSRAILWSF